MPRLFTGIEIPPELAQRLAKLRSPLPGAKWIEPENLHITLRFVGDIDNRIAGEFADFLSEIEVGVFELRVSGLGVFGGNDPRTLWAEVHGGPELETLARANERAARAAGLPPETRAFKAHVTLARLRHTRPDVVARFLQHNGGFRSEPFVVERFVLFSSRPQTGGGPYVVEDAYPLLGASPAAGLDAESGW